MESNSSNNNNNRDVQQLVDPFENALKSSQEFNALTCSLNLHSFQCLCELGFCVEISGTAAAAAPALSQLPVRALALSLAMPTSALSGVRALSFSLSANYEM